MLPASPPLRYRYGGDVTEELSVLTPVLGQSGLVDEGAGGVMDLPLQADPLAREFLVPALEPTVGDLPGGEGRSSEVDEGDRTARAHHLEATEDPPASQPSGRQH